MENMQVPTAAEFVTLEDFLNWSADFFEKNELFYGHGTDNPWDESVMLALYVLQLPAKNDISILQQHLTSAQQKQLLDLALLRADKRVPVPYLTNEAWFAGERYYVNEHVLIPRSPLAETIANHFQPWLGRVQPKRILDLCTGSGCLAIYCAKQFSSCNVDAVDISADALNVARKNVTLHHCESRVHVIHSDLFSALAGKKYDVIISNPPYVSAQEMASLPQEFKYEPVLALESGEDGLDLTVKILQQAAQYLTEDGLLIVEVGDSWHALEAKYPNVAFTWLEFEYGGEGVFLLTAEYLRQLKL